MTRLEDEFFAIMDEDHGVFFHDVIVKKIFAVLYLSDDFVPLEEVAKKASLSLASVSNKTKTLSQLGLIERVRKAGSKKVFLKAKSDFVSLIEEKTRKKNTSLVIMQEHVSHFIASQQKRKLSDAEKEQMKHLLQFNKQIKKLISLHKKMIKIFEEGV